MTTPLNRILLVEDDQDIADVAKISLEDIGQFEVQHCLNGQKALATLNWYKPDIILMDVMMPVMDGIETLQAIQALPKEKVCPIIFMTAKAQVHEQQEYIDIGAQGVIVKPFDVLSLPEQVKALWEQSQS